MDAALPLEITELTSAALDGTGVLDVMLSTMRLHLDREFQAGRIRGADYATVYLSAYNATVSQAIQYSLSKLKLGHELALLQAQVDASVAQNALTAAQTAAVNYELTHKAPAEVLLLQKQAIQQDAQTAHTLKQTEMVAAQIGKIPEEIALLQQQALQVAAQTSNATAETALVQAQTLKVPIEVELLNKQKLRADQELLTAIAQTAQVNAQVDNTLASTANLAKQGLGIEAQTTQTTAQTALIQENILKAPLERGHLEAQTELLNQQGIKLQKDVLLQTAQIELAYAQIDLSKAELSTKLKQLDLLMAQIAAQQSQSQLYAQKVITERAQVDSTVIGPGSVLSTQNAMIKAQTDGFRRDAEQKVAKILVDTWSVRRNTDSGVSGNSDNYLNDATIGAAMTALLQGVGVTPRG